MKKLSTKFALCCAIGLTSLLGCNEKKPQVQALAAQPTELTLSGIDKAKAGEMVAKFRADMVSSEKTTSFWYSEKFLDAIISVLHYDGGDGVRFYFAKDDKGLISLIPVSTKDAGPRKDPKDAPRHVHQDYFTHTSTQLQQPYASYTAERAELPGENLYNLTTAHDRCTASVHYVPAETASRWAIQYQDPTNQNLPLIGTKSVFYPLELFTNLKAYLTAAKLRGLDGDGFRIYIIKKDDDTVNNIKGAVSLVFVPTIEKDKQHHDYYDCFINAGKFKAKPATDPNDNGEECPTFCNEGTSWDNP